MTNYILAVSTAILLNSCSSVYQTANNHEDSANINAVAHFVDEQKLPGLDKISPFTLRKFMALDDQHIAVMGSNKKHFILTMPVDCKDMKFAKKINIFSAVENELQVGQDKITRIGDSYSPCIISGIYAISQVQFDELAHLNREIRSGKDNYPTGI